jgi:hypothetical protein
VDAPTTERWVCREKVHRIEFAGAGDCATTEGIDEAISNTATICLFAI